MGFLLRLVNRSSRMSLPITDSNCSSCKCFCLVISLIFALPLLDSSHFWPHICPWGSFLSSLPALTHLGRVSRSQPQASMCLQARLLPLLYPLFTAFLVAPIPKDWPTMVPTRWSQLLFSLLSVTSLSFLSDSWTLPGHWDLVLDNSRSSTEPGLE